MPEEYRNIYKTARRAAGLTQEAAAERLGISVESIRAYETGQRIPPNDVVARMSVQYNDLMLGYEHCRSTNDLIATIVPKLERRSLLEVAVMLYNGLRQFDAEHNLDALMKIAEDGRVDSSEEEDFDGIMEDLRRILKPGLELECCAESFGP